MDFDNHYRLDGMFLTLNDDMELVAKAGMDI